MLEDRGTCDGDAFLGVGMHANVPELLPARMINEYVYCPRLFFLEWVDRLWAANSDVAEGLRVHRRVDDGGGAAPLPAEGELIAARSVELSSETLGITAKLDLIEGDGDAVIPVDTKKGRPNRDGTAWPADAVQVCAQVLLLREHEYNCDHGVLFYRETRQRVVVQPTDELIEQTLKAVVAARKTAAELRPPPPLVNSPKCPRCSLAGICLPDEITSLARGTQRPPRRLIAASPDQKPLYVAEQGTTVGIDGGRVTISKLGSVLADLRAIDVSHLCLYGNVQVTAQAMRTFFDRDIGVFHFSYGGWLQGVTTGLPSKNVQLRIRQVTAAARGDLSVPRRMISGKIRNCRVLLRRHGTEQNARSIEQLAELALAAEKAESAGELLGTEGVAARIYFDQLPSILGHAEALPGPRFSGLRNRRPPVDAVNCLLSFCYGLLTKEILAALIAVGFDPYIGLFHRPRFGRPALALDLAEEFRPLVADSTVLGIVNHRQLRPSDFVIRAGAVNLTAEGRKTVIHAWERRMAQQIRHPLFSYTVSYRRAIELQARILSSVLIGEIERYEPLVTR